MNSEKVLNKNRRFKVRWFFVLLCVLLIAGLLPNASDSVEAASGKWRHITLTAKDICRPGGRR